jgi:hypothetical protein
MVRIRALWAAPVAAALVSSCGGGDGGTAGPGPVARVEVTAPSATIEVGAVMALTTRYFDGRGTQLSGKTVTYSSSAPAIASVDQGGNVTGAAEGNATITATVDGTNGSVAVSVVQPPVVTIAITPANPAVRPGETITLSAQPFDGIGRPIARTVTWSSAHPARATVTQSGVVTGVASGMVYIRAEAGGTRDSVNLRVRSLVAPSITGTSAGELTPGGAGTLTGTNFGATTLENEVLVNGARATVTAASATSVSFTVPAALGLPCRPTGPAQIALVANADTATTTMPLRMATPRALAPGASLLLATEGDLFCNEFAGNGGRYLITAFNFATNAGVRTSFQLLGASTAAAIAGPVAAAPVPVRRGAPADDRATRHLRAHLTHLSRERALARSLGSPRVRERMRRDARAPLSVVPNPPPAVGTMLTYRMRRDFGNLTQYDEVRFRVAYVGPKLLILEDSLAPTARTMDVEFQRMGQEFDAVMFPLLSSTFGDPTVVDSALDNNGRIIALFSKRVNDYVIAGVNNAILGFVTLCDYFPRTPQVIDGVQIPACPSSNEGEVFYAIVPDPAGGISVGTWERFMRGTLIHEAKHIDSYAWRYYLEANVEDLEEIWLEEATAQEASEMWARGIYQRNQFDDIAWADGPRCDYAPVSGGCPNPVEGILHHFNFLYEHYNSNESKSILDDPGGPVDPVVYGSSWSFARWVTDTYGASEPTFLGALNRVQNDHGVQNISSKAGRPFSELLGLWSLASLADNYPGAMITDPRVRLPSWNTRDLFLEMSRNLVSGGQPAFPRAWPLNVRQVTFGPFTAGQSQVTLLRGGGFVAWELSGAQTAPQVLAIRATDGGLPPSLIGLAIVRIQ